MRIHQIRNATLRIDFGGKTFLVDPMLAPKNEYPPITDISWPTCDLPIPAKDIVKNIDALIITHLHIDHFDKFAEDLIQKSTKIYVQDIFDKNALEKDHFSNIEVLSESGTKFEEVTLYKTPCMHGIREKSEPVFLANGMRWEAMGVIFKSKSEPVLYLSGDTIWYDGVKNTISYFKPDYIIVNSACAKAGGSGPIIMGIEDIRRIHEYSPELKIIASHMDCVGHATVTREDLQNSEVSKYTIIPTNGELMIFEK